MIRLRFAIQLGYEIANPGCDLILNIHAAQTIRQTIVAEQLHISQIVASNLGVDIATHNRPLRFSALPGFLRVSYEAVVDIRHYTGEPDATWEVPIPRMPTEVLQYVYPSRYCESDRLLQFASRAFGQEKQGYFRVQHVRDWVLRHTTFASNSSDFNTSAVDTLLACRGVCRDFAHLMIALCRALNIPARFVTGIDYGADPALGPTDFHAYVEVYLADRNGSRWYIFDPSGTAIPMGFVRIATGRDAADVAFANIFGPVVSNAPIVQVEALSDSAGRLNLPLISSSALSTME